MAQRDPRSNLAELILTEGVRAAIAKGLQDVPVTAVLLDDDVEHPAGDADLYDVVDSALTSEGVVLMLRRRQ